MPTFISRLLKIQADNQHLPKLRKRQICRIGTKFRRQFPDITFQMVQSTEGIKTHWVIDYPDEYISKIDKHILDYYDVFLGLKQPQIQRKPMKTKFK